MNKWKLIVPIAAVLLYSGQAVAQSEEEKVREFEEARQVSEVRRAEYSERLREAEERMEQAARQIAEITRERLPQIEIIQRRMAMANKPRIGITIAGDSDSGPVDGVAIDGVTPESAADEAGLRAGDIITAVNGDSMSATSSEAANELLLNLVKGVEEGDELKVDYLRNGRTESVGLSPRVVEMHAFSWSPNAGEFHIEQIPGVPDVLHEFRFDGGFPFGGSAWGRMELIELSEGLGKYFGTDSGLLVVSAPEVDGFELKDGDVIKTIDGRVPNDVRHAMKILSSYQSGEKLELGIMRDKKKRKLDVAVPADQRGSLYAPMPAKPARAPAVPRPPAADTAST